MLVLTWRPVRASGAVLRPGGKPAREPGDLVEVPAVVVPPHLENLSERDGTHVVPRALPIQVLGREAADAFDVRGAEQGEFLERRLVRTFVVVTLACQGVAIDVDEKRIRLSEHAEETDAVALRLDVPQMMDVLARGESVGPGFVDLPLGRESGHQLSETRRSTPQLFDEGAELLAVHEFSSRRDFRASPRPGPVGLSGGRRASGTP